MRTHSHFLITAFFYDLLNRHRPPIRPGNAFLVGSVLPDVPLMFLTLWYFFRRVGEDDSPTEENPFYGPEYDAYYFNNFYWILLTSLFHAPFLLIVYVLIGLFAKWMNQALAVPWLWLCLACTLHSLLDILTHVQDGIVILFPFNTNYRFHSCVSYYEPDHGGQFFTAFEYSLDLLLLIYFVLRAIQYSLSQKQISRYIEVQQYVMDNPIV